MLAQVMMRIGGNGTNGQDSWIGRRRYGHRGFGGSRSSRDKDKWRTAQRSMLDSSDRSQNISTQFLVLLSPCDVNRYREA